MDAEVIIIGAGPAGATAAYELAAAGHDVLLLDKSEHPRAKICGGWVNRRVPEMFPWVDKDALETPFTGIEFFSPDLGANVSHEADESLGYLADRQVFDASLVEAAKKAGARFQVGECYGVTTKGAVTLADGSLLKASVVVGADGVQSVVGSSSGLNPGWDNRQVVICASTDFKLDPARLDEFYGAARKIYISPAYSFVSGYGWAFPKKTHISVGIGGRLHDTNNIVVTFKRFVDGLVEKGVIPEECKVIYPDSGITPAGAALGLPAFADGRVVLVGDAGGFASATSGEGIFPGMWSAKIAAGVIDDALKSDDVETALKAFTAKAQSELGGYLKPPTDQLPKMLLTLFQDKEMAGRFAAAFLDGKDL